MKMGRRLAELLFAPRANCLGCGSELGTDRGWLCARCYAALQPLSGSAARQELCPECGEEKKGRVCPACGKRTLKSVSACAALAYRPPTDSLIRRYKFDGVYRLDDFLGGELMRAVREAGLGQPTLIVPVPLHYVRRMERGFNQSERLARIAAKALHTPAENALKRRRNTPKQSGLSEEKRRTNLRDAFEAVRRLDGERVLLIDDVRTTGSTVIECAKALKAAGAESVFVATVAKTMAKDAQE